MSSQKEDNTKRLHENSERISNFIELTCIHRFLSSFSCGSSSVLQSHGSEVRQRLTTIQTQIIHEAFEIMKVLLPTMKRVNAEADSDLKAALELQWIDFTGGLELYTRDIKMIFYLHEATSAHGQAKSALLTWDGIRTGLHTPPSVCDDNGIAARSPDAKEENKPPSARMEDSIRKIAMILHSLHTQIAVHAWSVEHYSSFHTESILGGLPRRYSLGYFKQILEETTLLFRTAGALILVAIIIIVVLGIVGIF